MGDFDFNFNPKPIKIKPISLRGSLPRKRDVQRQVNPFKRVREPLSAKLKHKVEERAHNHCEWRGCTHKDNLNFHHKNMNNDDNRLSNIILLCPNHHAKMHEKYKKVASKDMITGKEMHTRVVKSENVKAIKKRRREKNSLIPKLNPQTLDFGGFGI